MGGRRGRDRCDFRATWETSSNLEVEAGKGGCAGQAAAIETTFDTGAGSVPRCTKSLQLDRTSPVGFQLEQAIGFKHLAFDVPKLEPAIEALREDGIEPDPVIDFGAFIPGSRLVFFRDPEGNIRAI